MPPLTDEAAIIRCQFFRYSKLREFASLQSTHQGPAPWLRFRHFVAAAPNAVDISCGYTREVDTTFFMFEIR